MQIDFSGHKKSYHTVPLNTISSAAADKVLSEDRKKYLRSIAKDKSGQSIGKGALSAASKNVYTKLLKQAAIKKLWLQDNEIESDDDDTPLTDVEYDDEEFADSEAGELQMTQESTGAGKRMSQLMAAAAAAAAGAAGDAGGSSRGKKPTPPPAKKQKTDHYPKLIDVLNSFEMPSNGMEFSLEELYKFSSMSNIKIKLTDWMVVMTKLTEVQMTAKLNDSADEIKQLKKENALMQETIDQQKTVITDVNKILQGSR